MQKNLVIVESPAKAKTIEKFLGKDFKVLSSYGHIRDLKKKEFSIDVEKNFKPNYEIPADKKAALLLGRKRILVFEDRGGVADDARQRRADIVRHRAQEIGAHGFLFCFDAQPLLLFDLRVHRADHHGHRQHRKIGRAHV